MLIPENYFQATSRKPNMRMFWLIAVLSVLVVSAVMLSAACGESLGAPLPDGV